MLGLIFNVLIISIATAFLAQNTVLWVLLLGLNIPIYLMFAKAYFSSFDEMKWSLDNLLQTDSIKATPDEEWAGYRGWVFVAVCLAVVTAEYKLITWLIS